MDEAGKHLLCLNFRVVGKEASREVQLRANSRLPCLGLVVSIGAEVLVRW